MIGEKFEKLGSVFLMVLSTGLAAVLAADGMDHVRWPGAAMAVAGSMALGAMVRLWPHPAAARIDDRRDAD
ncbi:MAG TPA: hypothetical protein VLI41_15710 [Phenylobacterium sp.]|uniref:hypothetical protein n=1 Tax=Phenylobacterium sp. TaxID=1871053 RepID=UPI002CE5E52A|nr:hypothetical protein [Phenylobacterium sp.]HSV04642.1 hypothetical protein [Phenylobacterium sp.]